jgi:hypothetical protein
VSFDDIRSGSVIRYPYLWAREARRGELEGRKPRPVVVAIRMKIAKAGDLLLMFPITTQPPPPQSLALEIPEAERLKAGLDSGKRLWIIFDEYNEDSVGESFYLSPDPPIGKFGRVFFLKLIDAYIANRPVVRGVKRNS